MFDMLASDLFTEVTRKECFVTSYVGSFDGSNKSQMFTANKRANVDTKRYSFGFLMLRECRDK